MQKERQARELAEKEKNELLEKLNRLEEEATKARDGKILKLLINKFVNLVSKKKKKTHINSNLSNYLKKTYLFIFFLISFKNFTL